MAGKDWKELLIDQLYGELDPQDERTLEEHLAAHPADRRTAEQLSAIRGMLHEAAPEVPATPRVVVLQPRPTWPALWNFAAGAAFAMLIFGFGVLAGPLLRGQEPVNPPETVARAGVPAGARTAEGEGDALLIRGQMAGLEQRLARLEQPPIQRTALEASQQPLLTRDEWRREVRRIEARLNQERERDLEFLLGTMTASELRTGSKIEETRDVVNYLALSQNPDVTEY